MHISRTHIFLAGLVFSVAALSIFITAIEAQPASGKINFHDNFSSGKLDAWQFPFPEDWVVKEEGPLHFLHMLRNREPLVPRRPQQFALVKGITVESDWVGLQVGDVSRPPWAGSSAVIVTKTSLLTGWLKATLMTALFATMFEWAIEGAPTRFCTLLARTWMGWVELAGGSTTVRFHGWVSSVTASRLRVFPP